MASKSREENIIDDIANNDKAINADLYKAYSENLRKGVGSVFFEDDGSGLSDRLRANVSRFAAYKAYHATQQVREWMTETGSIDDAKKVLHRFNRYQAAEYNTTVSRCRTAKQWQEFDKDDSRRLFPNIEWLPSRSVKLREEHVVFYNRVWAKDDPFWSRNQPGNLWNCKCDWEETDAAVTDGNPHTAINANGLDGNPGVTGEVFTDECTYVKHAGENRKERDKTEVKCEMLNKVQTLQNAKKELLNSAAKCYIESNECDVVFIPRGIDHYSRDLMGKKEVFWLKNEILPNIAHYIKDAKCAGWKISDTTHNTRKETVKLKENTDKFFYFPIDLPNGRTVVLHLGRYKIGHEKEGKLYLYSISNKYPKEMETP